MSPPERILFLRGGALGDFLLTLPAIRAVREHCPEAHVALIAAGSHARFAMYAGLTDEWRDLESAGLAPFFDENAAADADWTQWLRGFDLIVSWLTDPHGVFHRRLSGAGVGEFCQGNGRPGSGPRTHAAMQLGEVLRESQLRISLNAADLSRPLLPRIQGKTDACLALHPGSGSPRKNWPAQNWCGLLAAQEIRGRFDSVLLVSGEVESEGDAVRQILSAANAAGYRIEHAAGLPLDELSEKLRVCAFFLGHDSGVSHLAGLLGLQGLALFGPTDPVVWCPPGDSMRTASAEPPGPMEDLRIGAVLAALDEVSDRSPR